VKDKGEAEVTLQVPFVKFIEDHRADAVQRGIALEAPRQHAFGDDLDARTLTHATVAARAIPSESSNGVAKQVGDPKCGGPGGDAARLEHDDDLVAEPRRGEERGRDERRFPRTGRGLKHDTSIRLQRVEKRWEHRLDREASHGARLRRVD